MTVTKIYRLMLAVLLFATSSLYAQTRNAQRFDVNGEYIHGTIDPFSYNPDQFLNMIYNSEGFEKGVYYDKEGIAVKGWVKYDEKFIKYKKEEFDTSEKIQASELTAVRIGVDSFFVTENFKVLRRAGLFDVTAPNFFQYIGENDQYVFARHYLFTSGLGQYYLGASPIIITYQYLKKGTKVWRPIERNEKKFEAFCRDVFQDVIPVMNKIDGGQLGVSRKEGSSSKVSNDDIYSQIRIALRWDKFVKNEDVLFDQFWNEVNEGEESEYYAKVTSVKDTIWNLSYFKNETKLYDVQYSHFYPDRLNGTFVSYSGSGDTLKMISYENDERKNERYFHSNGKPNLEFKRDRRKVKGLKYLDRLIYGHNDEAGNSLIPKNTLEYTIRVDEPDGDFSIEYSYENGNLEQVRSIYSDREFRQFSDLNTDYDMKKLKNMFNGFFDDFEFPRSVEKNVQGKILIGMQIDSKGKILKAERLNELYPEVDEVVDTFISKYLTFGGAKWEKLRPYKVGKVKTAVEYVVPLVFSVNRFYRKPTNYYHHNFMLYNNMLNQQMMQQHMNNISVPTFSAPSF